ncbi:MAG TPA: chloride channel protein [Candidatus Angelobacter sp.]|jgi:CIC family chloride channel protein|nr:chloride channel protein [Candidatus Angelobacter sp.]
MVTTPFFGERELEISSTPQFRGSRLVLATIITGLVAGIGSVVFHYLADSNLLAWCESHTLRARLPVVLAVPTIGLCLIGVVLQLLPGSRIGGVKEVFEALQKHHAVIPVGRILNVILSALVLAFGGSVGPEGPMVQLGALVGSQIGQRTGLARHHLATMVQAGAAAGIAAAFRSPAGGVLLVLELFGARFNRGLAAIGAAAVIGYVARTAIVGDAYPFRPGVTLVTLPLATSFLIVPIMGLLAAPTGHFFIRIFNLSRKMFPIRWPLAVRVAMGGLMVGGIAIRFPQVLSAGYPVIEHSLNQSIGFELCVILLGLKMAATSITFGSGAVGGLFAPTLVIGAMYGGVFGFGLHRLAPAAVPQPELFVLLGMVVMFGSIAKGYWSGLLMVADMSGCYHQLLLPGVIAGGISFLVSWEMHDMSIFGLPIDPAREFDRNGT